MIENIIEYNRINHKSYGLNSINLKNAGVNILSEEDLRTLATLLKSHPDINEPTLRQVERLKASNGKVQPLGTPRGTLLRYLEEFKNRKIEFKNEYASAEAERFIKENAEAERLSAKAEAERLRAKAEAEYLRAMAEAERFNAANVETDYLRAMAEAEYLRAMAEAERYSAANVEANHLRANTEAERVNAAKAESERLRIANAEVERLAKAYAEKDGNKNLRKLAPKK